MASLKMKCASLGLKQSGAREELIHRIEEATHESEEEPDVIAEDAEKAVHRTFEGKKARKKQWSGGRDSRTIRAEKEFAQKEKERLARDAERLAREAAKPKLLEALAPVKRKGAVSTRVMIDVRWGWASTSMSIIASSRTVLG